MNEHNLAGHGVGYKRLSSAATSGQRLLTLFHWTLNAAFSNMGKGARGLNRVGREDGFLNSFMWEKGQMLLLFC